MTQRRNQNWININLLPAKENEEAHIVLKISKRKFRNNIILNEFIEKISDFKNKFGAKIVYNKDRATSN